VRTSYWTRTNRQRYALVGTRFLTAEGIEVYPYLRIVPQGKSDDRTLKKSVHTNKRQVAV